MNIRERKAGGKIRYVAQVRVKNRRGKLISQTMTFDRLTDARVWGQRLEADIRRGRAFPEAAAGKKTFRDAARRYIDVHVPQLADSNQSSVIQRVEWWENRIGDVLLDKLDVPAVVEARRELETEKPTNGKLAGRRPRGPQTIKHYLNILNKILSLCCSDEWSEDGRWLDQNPILNRLTAPKIKQKNPRALSPEDQKKLLAACLASSNKLLAPAVVFALNTGARHGEQFGLTWADVSCDWTEPEALPQDRVFFPETKSGRPRAVPLNTPAKNALREVRSQVLGKGFLPAEDLAARPVFPARGDRGKNQGIDLRRPFADALKKAGLRDVNWHALRHTFATDLLNVGAAEAVVQKLLGHRSLAVTAIYAEARAQTMAAAVGKLTAKGGSK